MSHDQNFKNLVLDCPRAALALFAAAEAATLDPQARILPVRQEQLQERLGERFREPEKRLKYLDFIDIYADLSAEERLQYSQDYPAEAETMSRFAERFREEGMQQGEARVLERLLTLKFGALPAAVQRRIAEADEPTLLAWSERVLSAARLEDVLH